MAGKLEGNVHLLYTPSKRSTHFKLLASLMHPSFDTQPASFLQQFNAWKEQVVRYQQLSGESLQDFIKLTAVVNGLKGNVRHCLLLQLDGDSTFGDLDSLLGKYFNNTYVQSESSLNSVWDKAWRDKQKGKSKGKGKKPNPYYKQKLDKGGSGKAKERKEKEKEKAKASQPKEKGKLSLPSLQPTKARGSSSFQNENFGAISAGRKGIAPKLAGGTATSSNSSTNNKLGTTQTSNHRHGQRSAQKQQPFTSFYAEAAASSAQHGSADNLHQLDT